MIEAEEVRPRVAEVGIEFHGFHEPITRLGQLALRLEHPTKHQNNINTSYSETKRSSSDGYISHLETASRM